MTIELTPRLQSDKKGAMLRRLSDVTIGSIEKFLKIGGNDSDSNSEKKRKLVVSECEEEENIVDKENCGSRLRKSKGHWDLSTDPVSSSSSSNSFDDDSDEVESIMIDLEDIDSSEIPTDLSINEEEWTDYLNMEQYWNDDNILKDSDTFFDFDEIVYWNEIYKSMKMREQRGKVLSKEGLLRNHPDLTFMMRAKLINWLFEVGVHYKLQRETIYSTQILLDSFLSLSNKRSIPRTKLQLIGLSCLLISSKLEEVRPPNLSDLSMICDEMFGKQEIAGMELEICSTLKWFLTPINTLTWLRFYQNNLKLLMCEFDLELELEAKLDFLIHSSRILDFSPSKLAAALIAESLNVNCDLFVLEKCTGYKVTELKEELTWITSWRLDGEDCGSIAYVEPKKLKLLTDDQFDELIQNHRKSLNFILKKIKIE